MTETLFAILELARPGYPHTMAMQIASVLHTECTKHHLDPLSIVALMSAESSFNPNKVNKRTGCMGLMQVAPVHVQDWANPRDALGIRLNIEMGVALFARYLERCRFKTGHAVSFYNGRGECRDSAFSRKVLRIREQLRRYERCGQAA